jgi:serine protease Do
MYTDDITYLVTGESSRKEMIMRWAQRLLSVGALSAALAFTGMSAPAAANGLPSENFADLAAQVTPAVVSISTHRALESSADNLAGESADQEKNKDSLGSGFIIDPSGYVVTNNHVIADADEILVTLRGGKSFSATLIGADEKTDLALLKIDAPDPLPFVSFGDSDAIRVGDRVMAVGNPYGLGGTVTTGIVSATGRDLHAGAFDDFMQIDASINPGNSGGPCFDLKGQVIGVNTAIASPSGGSVGLAFAIPANIAMPIAQELRLHGRVIRGWIGISIQEITPDLAESLDLGQQGGALLTSIQPRSPAAAAGLQQGDVILAFDGHQLGEARELPRIVAGEPAGKRVSVIVWRDGSSRTVSLEVASKEEKPRVVSAEQGGRPTADSLLSGIQLASLTEHLRRQLAIASDVKGVAIVDLSQGSLAARLGLRAGDVIEQVERRYVSSPADVNRLVQQAALKGRSAVLLLVRRGSNELYLAAKSAKSKDLGALILYRPAARCA